MPKRKFELSQKHEYLINKLSEIPTIDEIHNSGWTSVVSTDYRYNTEDILLMIIEALTKGTQMENIGNEISEKARTVFDYYSDSDK
jgi:hypothetical protein